MAVQLAGLRQQVDRIGTGVSAISRIGCVGSTAYSKATKIATLMPLPPKDPQPCFASLVAEQDFYDQICSLAFSAYLSGLTVEGSQRCVRQSAAELSFHRLTENRSAEARITFCTQIQPSKVSKLSESTAR